MSNEPVPSIDLRSVHLRPARAEDELFFFEAFQRDRAPDFAALGLGAAELRALLRMQFDAQRSSYRAAFPNSQASVIRLGDRPIGRLWVARSPDEIRLLDIVLIAEYRSHGIGTLLLKEILAAAAREARPMRLMVAQTNTGAIRFYRRLGFIEVAGSGAHWLMENRPGDG